MLQLWQIRIHPTPVTLIASIGFLAGLLTTGSNVPQVAKTYRNRCAEGLSFKMLVALATGLGLWVLYGVLLRSWPIVLANAAGLALILSLIVMKFTFDSDPAKD